MSLSLGPPTLAPPPSGLLGSWALARGGCCCQAPSYLCSSVAAWGSSGGARGGRLHKLPRHLRGRCPLWQSTCSLDCLSLSRPAWRGSSHGMSPGGAGATGWAGGLPPWGTPHHGPLALGWLCGAWGLLELTMMGWREII